MASNPAEETLFRFIQSDNFGELRTMIVQHPELVSELAIDRMRQIMDDQIDIEAKRRVAERRVLLNRCLNLGVDEAFRGWFRPEPTDDDRQTDPRRRRCS